LFKRPRRHGVAEPERFCLPCWPRVKSGLILQMIRSDRQSANPGRLSNQQGSIHLHSRLFWRWFRVSCLVARRLPCVRSMTSRGSVNFHCMLEFGHDTASHSRPEIGLVSSRRSRLVPLGFSNYQCQRYCQMKSTRRRPRLVQLRDSSSSSGSFSNSCTEAVTQFPNYGGASLPSTRSGNSSR
jgi:hypothetical protein